MVKIKKQLLLLLSVLISNKRPLPITGYQISAPFNFGKRLFEQERLFKKITPTPGRLFGRSGYSAGGANSVIYGIQKSRSMMYFILTKRFLYLIQVNRSKSKTRYII